ncbi:tol-pal system protein YbgF [Psychrosphaera ytuae]|uniref:Cell division coordinator CpoB n=1 Tax=Psychrosphaera ytuae TaxID=2820710 RepID=A0A975HKV3_9GAMM|nr:tol-pal system protein YbgF [Psychrosphaera ytuae]QTH64694.1 tol-pal system protein YbgF [Psychrosphaera ytuae]
MRLSLLAVLFVAGASNADAPVTDLSTTGQLNEQVTQLKRLIQARGAAQVNLQQQINDLQEEVSELRGVTEEHSYKLDQIVDRQRELYIEIERRLSNLQQAPAPTQPEITEQPLVQEYGGSLGENEAYDQAVNLILKERRYDDAIPAFQKFIEQFPSSIYIPNAHYWLGQLQFNKANYNEAKKHFGEVISSYPDSTKRSDALLKQGTVLQKLGDTAAAKKLFQQVIAEFPESNSATLAKSRLVNLG